MTRASATRLAYRMIASTDEVLDSVDAAIREAGHLTARGPQHRRTVQRVRAFRWSWQIVDQAVSPHPVLASGRAFTQRRAWRRLERAYRRLLDGAR